MPYQFIIFDLETSDTGSKAEIFQLSAITQTGSMYPSYIMPKSNISHGASRVNNLTVEIKNGTRSLCKNSVPVAAMSIENALSSFIKFIQHACSINSCGTQSIPVLIGHNAAVFDVPVLLRNSGKLYDEQLDQINVNFGDSLLLIKSLIQSQHAPLKLTNRDYCRVNISSVYQCLFKDEFNAHDALEDVKALRKIFSPELAIDIRTIVNSSQIQTVCDARMDLDHIDKRLELFQTFVGGLYCPQASKSPITHSMTLKIAGSGLSYKDLYQT
ncbi:exonuclease R569 [Paramuricea clavata]|uniref:Exonuclease R569 n=1 Tax=Paramuricea clavata TaxID=317549 RepID=A0A7D9D9T8_PARCT|nr:exonuclease R569 [Paramuricea clavata]